MAGPRPYLSLSPGTRMCGHMLGIQHSAKWDSVDLFSFIGLLFLQEMLKCWC